VVYGDCRVGGCGVDTATRWVAVVKRESHLLLS